MPGVPGSYTFKCSIGIKLETLFELVLDDCVIRNFLDSVLKTFQLNVLFCNRPVVLTDHCSPNELALG